MRFTPASSAAWIVRIDRLSSGRPSSDMPIAPRPMGKTSASAIRRIGRSLGFAAMANRIALLRGINLGPSRRVAMGELRETLERAGYEDVRTHGQSGNVLLTSSHPPARLARELSA